MPKFITVKILVCILSMFIIDLYIEKQKYKKFESS